jgi:hypothetical protein
MRVDVHIIADNDETIELRKPSLKYSERISHLTSNLKDSSTIDEAIDERYSIIKTLKERRETSNQRKRGQELEQQTIATIIDL